MRRATIQLITCVLIGTMSFMTACSGCNPEQEDKTKTTNPPDETCELGARGCPCDAGRCDDGLECEQEVCTLEDEPDPEPTGLVFDSEQARACELLIEEQGGERVVSADYGEGTTGVLRRRGSTVALAVSQLSDEPFDVSSVALMTMGDISALTLTARCFDRQGAEIPDARVTWR